MKEIDELNTVINEQIERVQKGIGIDTDVAILKDIKRMSELGVLKVYMSSEIPEIKQEENKIFVEYKQPRLMFTGEDEIKRLSNELEQLKEQHKEDVNIEIAQSWGEFIIRCERQGRPLLLLIDFIEQYYQQTHEKK